MGLCAMFYIPSKHDFTDLISAQGYCHTAKVLGHLAPVKGNCNETARRNILHNCVLPDFVAVGPRPMHVCIGQVHTSFRLKQIQFSDSLSTHTFKPLQKVDLALGIFWVFFNASLELLQHLLHQTNRAFSPPFPTKQKTSRTPHVIFRSVGSSKVPY